MTFIEGSFLNGRPDECLICGEKLCFGDCGITWSCHKDFAVCNQCAPHFAISFLKDAAKTSEFQNLSEKQVKDLNEVTESAEFFLSLNNL